MESGKWQWIRLIDVLFLGPFMMHYALQTKTTMPKIYIWTLFFFGITTILVHAYFYIKIAKWF
jgi:hypothetical protein